MHGVAIDLCVEGPLQLKGGRLKLPAPMVQWPDTMLSKGKQDMSGGPDFIGVFVDGLVEGVVEVSSLPIYLWTVGKRAEMGLNALVCKHLELILAGQIPRQQCENRHKLLHGNRLWRHASECSASPARAVCRAAFMRSFVDSAVFYPINRVLRTDLARAGLGRRRPFHRNSQVQLSRRSYEPMNNPD